ncbi:Ceramide very long chain fatty acid hydroxylase SCS7 [Escovopsis weberi]|uniref:Ceramide very long chain fatty acid hydroxylase n=1 Tax=Escovopsis weberi TaxID=150374 RepID=A0A0M8MX26_ESCWE|nr:Ceramide very long chain fatty acid hydroxylase SCS7 [Escovopsis weberi]
MPSRTLPTLTRAEVEAHDSASSCYVTIGSKVFDVTDFLDDHPGGPQLILDYAGKDIEDILKDDVSHEHTETAYEILEESLVGFVLGEKKSAAAAAEPGTFVHPRTGMSSVEDLERETDYDGDFKKHKFLDLNKPLFMQVWRGGFTKEFYLDQVHRPRHYKGGQSAPLFGNFLEPLTKTPWWIIPIIWAPVVAYLAFLANEGLGLPLTAAIWLFGFGLWSLLEYVLHRFLFHVDGLLPDNRWGITAHFLLHGIHHYIPMDKYRLVMPPTLAVALISPFWPLAHTIFPNWYVATSVFSGALFGYMCYDLTHYFLHHQNLPLWYKDLKKYHLEHHFLDYELGYGVTSRFWDVIFGTELQPKVLKTK